MTRKAGRIRSRLTPANFKYAHMYLREQESFFPRDSIGGSAASRRLGKLLRLEMKGIGEVVQTDIAGDKMIFRKRGWCREFFREAGVEAGDWVEIERMGPYEYRVRPMAQQKERKKVHGFRQAGPG